ncbi:G-protein-signaling modulator 1-like isoform X1 [Gordionus sp. m RMFG-2023]|uniref:G-protein-signaling modulator 1-like isoform X1 n=1 Tax=Gordionus sp. m RMFG-2023 TaxID=3053472 RepID=UPI0031FD9F0F
MSTLPLTIQSIKSNKDIYITPNKGDNLSRENAKSMNIFTKIFTNHHLISNTSLKDITKNLFINHKIINPPLNSYHLTSINGSKISAHSNNSLPFDSYEEYKGVNKDALDEGLELAWMGQKLSQRQHYTEAITLFNKSLSFLLNSKYDIIFTSNDCKDNVTNNDNIVNNVENQVTYMDTLGRGYKIEEILSAQFQIDQIFITSYSPQLIQILNAIYSHLGNCHYFLRQNNMAFECHIRDLRLTMINNDKCGEFTAWGNLSNCFKMNSEFGEAVTCNEKQLSISRSLNDKESLIKALYNIGNLYHIVARFLHKHATNSQAGTVSIYTDNLDEGLRTQIVKCLEMASQYYEDALELCSVIRNEALLSRLYSNLGGIHYQLGDFEKSIHYNKMKLHVAIKMNDVMEKKRALKKLGNCFFFLGNFPIASQCYEQASETLDRAYSNYNPHLKPNYVSQISHPLGSTKSYDDSINQNNTDYLQQDDEDTSWNLIDDSLLNSNYPFLYNSKIQNSTVCQRHLEQEQEMSLNHLNNFGTKYDHKGESTPIPSSKKLISHVPFLGVYAEAGDSAVNVDMLNGSASTISCGTAFHGGIGLPLRNQRDESARSSSCIYKLRKRKSMENMEPLDMNQTPTDRKNRMNANSPFNMADVHDTPTNNPKQGINLNVCSKPESLNLYTSGEANISGGTNTLGTINVEENGNHGDEEVDFFDYVARFQSQRMNDQRYDGPSTINLSLGQSFIKNEDDGCVSKIGTDVKGCNKGAGKEGRRLSSLSNKWTSVTRRSRKGKEDGKGKKDSKYISQDINLEHKFSVKDHNSYVSKHRKSMSFFPFHLSKSNGNNVEHTLMDRKSIKLTYSAGNKPIKPEPNFSVQKDENSTVEADDEIIDLVSKMQEGKSFPLIGNGIIWMDDKGPLIRIII